MSLVKNFLKKFFANPYAGNLDIDSKVAVDIHRQIIRSNPLLVKHYEFIYNYFKKIDDSLPQLGLPALEIGSGGGFLKEILPKVITSDVVLSEGIDRIENACQLTFDDKSLKAIYANGVLHHLKDPGDCLEEVQRVLAPGGVFVCNEPSSNFFGYFMNRYFHNEPTDKYIKDWQIPQKAEGGRLTGANMAIAYIIFKRDRIKFSEKFPNLRISSIIYHDFLRYSLSGGLSYRPFVPRFLFCVVNFFEMALRPLMSVLGNNMIVTIQKI